MKRPARLLLAALACVLAACVHREPLTPTAGSAPAVEKIDKAEKAEAPAAGTGAGDDPWQTVPDPSAPPDLGEAHALADKACPKVARPYFYRIEKGGKTSYMLGSRHLGVPLSKMPENVRRQIRASKLLVFEVAPGDESDEKQPDQPPLSTQLGPQLWAHYKTLVGSANADAVEHGPPTTAMLVLIALYENKVAALDLEIERVAADAKIPTQGLESAQFQDRLLHELMNTRMLKAAIAGTPDRKALEKQSFHDVAEYCAGTDEEPGTDAEGRKQLKAGGFTDVEIDALDEKLVYARNRDWIPKLEKLFANGDVMVVVGADHLVGKKGVISALAGRGFKTTRVPAQ
ncbi:MAG: TraB/GumN family protein [Deltaproteobacteria bacterium]|nr:TraB/GumN family protein [Deltaproteobacteria bacterium]